MRFADKRFFVLLLVVGSLFWTKEVVAQNYTGAVGLRLGFPAGVTYKQFLGRSNAAIEGILGFYGKNGVDLGVLLEFHPSILVDDLTLVYGPGVYVGVYDKQPTVGVGGIFGLEYTFHNAPINFMFDVQPGLALEDGGVFFRSRGGFSVRYVFGQ